VILRAYGELVPRLHESVWIAPGAAVIGDVEIGADSSVFYGSVLRGDVERIRIGERTNIQDQVVVHVTAGRHPALIGDEVTVGHRAVVHGCVVGDGALIGIGAVVLDGAEVPSASLVTRSSRDSASRPWDTSKRPEPTRSHFLAAQGDRGHSVNHHGTDAGRASGIRP
jgi:carbonic anhydrase/acetyltransferase-like protein (isoleucine patch superfamily)